jgi:hypothetical protein
VNCGRGGETERPRSGTMLLKFTCTSLTLGPDWSFFIPYEECVREMPYCRTEPSQSCQCLENKRLPERCSYSWGRIRAGRISGLFKRRRTRAAERERERGDLDGGVGRGRLAFSPTTWRMLKYSRFLSKDCEVLPSSAL